MEVLQMIIQQFIDQDERFTYHWKCEKPLDHFKGGSSQSGGLFRAPDFEEGHLPLRYLGLPLIAGRLTISDYKPLLLKIDSRIQGWDGIRLSFAGRLQLIKLVLMALEIYWAMAFILPKGIIKEVEKRLRSFLWKGTSNRGYPKGLGILSVGHMRRVA
ncbi:UNVERIFIED_CONTAM: hypothetical protein Slati_2212900 [Sesamum latifolium]|uniref:Uncharacterized protein n=1 Tax=Sesamum latifolium TaxID=2727402 RepID=A0AAW2WWM7_9LAMI